MVFNLFSKYRYELVGISAIRILFCYILTNVSEHGITEFSVFSQVTMLGSPYVVDSYFYLELVYIILLIGMEVYRSSTKKIYTLTHTIFISISINHNFLLYKGRAWIKRLLGGHHWNISLHRR